MAALDALKTFPQLSKLDKIDSESSQKYCHNPPLTLKYFVLDKSAFKIIIKIFAML